MTFKKGDNPNPNGARKERRFYAALERAVLQDDGKKLRAAAEKLLDNAAAGEPWAINALADRLDGKPGQTIDMNVQREVRDYSAEELLERLAEVRGRIAAGASEPQESAGEPSALH